MCVEGEMYRDGGCVRVWRVRSTRKEGVCVWRVRCARMEGGCACVCACLHVHMLAHVQQGCVV